MSIPRVLLTVAAAGALVAGTVAVASAGEANKEPPTVTASDVMPYLHMLQQIADRNGGNRADGTPGYRQSVEAVKQVLDANGFHTRVQGVNLIADWPGGDEKRTLMVGAHLDGVPEGPGINDNGSGSAVVLATAVAVARSHLKPKRHLRFAWWGAEEKGLVGSKAYLDRLSPVQIKHIAAYLNVDMAGINDAGSYMVIDFEDGTAQPIYDYLKTQNRNTIDIPAGGSDGQSFRDRGIPVSGFNTGLDDCYHRACDRVENIKPDVETLSANTMIHAVWGLA
ncbi:M20/M25/M40 family metallo-hydrolase [Pseudosporangium ferrugineum]|nr:M20/M25/M40 family metallo-hydrolase [Pseudosporangium ferrugineum]